MRIVIINTDYGPFLKGLYEGDPSLTHASYDEQMRRRNDTLFGGADFYSRHFIALGHDAWDVHANNGVLQSTWFKSRLLKSGQEDRSLRARLHRMFSGRVDAPTLPRRPPHPSPLRSPIEPSDIDLEGILVEQVRTLKPDVVLNQAVSEVESRVLHQMRPYTRLIVGQIASPYPEEETYTAYDMMVSSLPNFVRYYRSRGLPAERVLLGFEPTVLERVGTTDRDVAVSFVGSLTPDHSARFNLLERLASNTDIAIWGRLASVPEESPIMRKYRGEAWGRDMFHVLARSKITVNQHIDIAENYANNMRLFEATGMGALLITDWKDNIAELYEPGKEVVCYRSTEECIALIRYYREHDAERAAIAAAGQRRTLKDHTYASCVAHLARLFAEKLATSPGR
jgi:spore maturation protein CgeB